MHVVIRASEALAQPFLRHPSRPHVTICDSSPKHTPYTPSSFTTHYTMIILSLLSFPLTYALTVIPTATILYDF